jgi:hypothetical protein
MGYGTIDILCLIWLLSRSVEGRAYDVDTLFYYIPSYISVFFLFPSFLFYFTFLGWALIFTSLECSTFPATSVRVYACVSTYEFGSFDIDSYLRTGLQVSHSDASAEYEDRATSTCM